MGSGNKIRQFFFPSLTPRFLIRVSFVALGAYLFFGHLLIPIHIRGTSMEPTYRDGTFNFCWRGSYLFSKPKRHDVVTVRFAGNRVMLLKRIVALEGEQVAFRNGRLMVEDKELEEPYVRLPCHWNLPPRQVDKGCVYVVGDNRSLPMETHYFGQTPVKRIVGVPLW